MDEFLLGLLYVIAESLLEAFRNRGRGGHLSLSRAIGEAVVNLRPFGPILSTLGYVFLGLISGIVSVFLFPHPLVPRSRFHGVSLVVSPLITGLVMSQVGLAVRRRGRQPAQIEGFRYGFAFAFAMALIRFAFVK
jgi:hypothetical protein